MSGDEEDKVPAVNPSPLTAAANMKSKVRGGHKAHMSKMLHRLQIITNDYGDELEPELLAVLESVERKSELLKNLDAEILMTLGDDEDIMKEIETSGDFQTKINVEMTKARMFLAKKKKIPVTSWGAAGSFQGFHQPPRAPIRNLPKIEIKEFSGDPKEFQSFIDCFESSLSIYDITDVQKFTYLKKYLTGDAEQAIAGLALTTDNYQEAMEILKERFGNKQVVVNSHMEALIALSAVRSETDSKGMRLLYDKIEIHLRSLKNLGIQPDMYGALLVPVLKSKLPHEINLILSRKFDSSKEVWEIR